MKKKLLTGAAIALILGVGGLFVMANPQMPPKGADPKPDAGKKAEPEGKPEVKKPETAPALKPDEAKAKKALTDAFDKRNKSKGFHFSGTKTTQYLEMGMTSPENFTGVRNNTDNLLYALIKKTVMGNERQTELYQKGDKKFAQVMGSGDRADETTYSPLMQADRFVKDALKDYKFGEEETIDEVEYVTLEASIKDEGVTKLLAELPPMGALPADLTVTTEATSFKIWVNKKTSLISRIAYSVEVSATMPDNEEAPKSGRKIEADIAIVDYDKDIAIKLPDEVKKVLTGVAEPPKKK